MLEIGAGIGNLTGRLMSRRALYVAAEKDPLHLHALRNRFLRTPNVVVQRIDPEVPGDLAGLENCFDTVLCLNVLEYLDDPGRRARIAGRHDPAGRSLLVLVPNVPGVYGTLDRKMGHKRRYTPGHDRPTAGARTASRWKRVESFNKVGAAALVGLQQIVRQRAVSASWC